LHDESIVNIHNNAQVTFDGIGGLIIGDNVDIHCNQSYSILFLSHADCVFDIGSHVTVDGQAFVLISYADIDQIQFDHYRQECGGSLNFIHTDDIVLNNSYLFGVVLYCINVDNITIYDCEFDESRFYYQNPYAGNVINIQYCDFINTPITSNPAIDLAFADSYIISHNNILNNSGAGIRIAFSSNPYAENHDISYNTISNNGYGQSPIPFPGICIYSSYATIRYNNIYDNYWYGIQSLNNSTVRILGNSQARYCYETQIICDNQLEEVWASQNSFPVMMKWNAIFDYLTNHHLVYYNKESANEENYDITYNSWGEDFYPGTPEMYFYPIEVYTWQPIWNLIYEEPPIGNDEDLYQQANLKAEQGGFNAAKADYLQLISTYPSSIFSQAALRNLVPLEKKAGNNYSALKSYFLCDSTILNNYLLNKIARSMAIQCDIETENWQPAIDSFETIINNPTSLEDSVFAIIDLSYTYILMQNGGYKSTYTGTMPQYKFETHQQCDKNRDYLLSLLVNNDNMSKSFRKGLSSLQGGQLMQNVPNPFTGRTDIYYKLDNPSDVSIKVYNLVGQMVCEINEEAREVGTYRTTFDATGMPAGMYYCSLLVNGKVSDSKKMVLN